MAKNEASDFDPYPTDPNISGFSFTNPRAGYTKVPDDRAWLYTSQEGVNVNHSVETDKRPFSGKGDPDANLPRSDDSTFQALGIHEPIERRLLDLSKESAERTRVINAEMESRLEDDRARQQQQYDATAVQPGEFKKWDADEQSRKFHTDPLQAFGSLGSVFGMIASAFTAST